jgi:hypothetical protein
VFADQFQRNGVIDASCLEEATKHAAEALALRFGRGSIEGRIRAFVVTAIR